jgi:MFS family permease
MDSTNDSLLRNSRFLRLWIGQGTSFVGDAVSMVALVVLVVEITGSASAVGGALVARLLPTIASPLAGVIADRVDRRVVLVASDLARAVFVLGLVFARDLATIYILVFLMGLARTVFNPTVRAAFPSVVGGGDLTRANALISGTFSTSIMVGPALGGLLVATVDVDVAFVLDAVTYLVSAILLSTVPMPRPRRESEEGAGFVRELRSGFGYLLGARIPLAIVVGAFLTILTINATVPAEVFLAKETFGAGDAGYGLLVGLWGGGMVLGSAMMAVLGDRINLVLMYFLSIFVGACALVGTGLAPVFVLALVALTIEGAATGIDNVATDTILQQRVPEAFLGRVFSIRFLSYSVGEALAYPAGGLLVDAVGPRSTYILAGIATAAAGLLVLLAMITIPLKGRTQADQVPRYRAEKRE